MEGCATEGGPPAAEQEAKSKQIDSAMAFQRFVYDLFEKNGILNDLRAYLRGHIVDVLKNAQTGEPPTCQKHFTQRLELTYQALNMLVAEYLLRLEFSYSLSVFVSEIPLANMVFSFAKHLMLNSDGDFEDLRFKDNDVWSILNYLGVKCDSEHASQIVEMYNGKENLPLLFCILKSLPMYNKDTFCQEQAVFSSDSLSSSAKSVDVHQEKHVKSASKVYSAHEKCKHYVFCKPCQARMSRLKEKYKTKKKHLIQNIESCDPMTIESLLRNIGAMERSLVDEMFQQLKSVYESEMEMMKQEEEKKVKRSLASHALQLQKRKDEMEESFAAREAELERGAQEKKKFLWGLARALRRQHAAVARAMLAVRAETDRLAAKEDSLKSQLLAAEEVLKNRGEDMRKQISSELIILEEHLESMKRERENINRERAELDNLKTACNSSVIKIHDLNNEDLKSHYDLLKDEIGILKKYIETTRLEPRCVIERSTLTEPSDLGPNHHVGSNLHVGLNNEKEAGRAPLPDEERRTPNKVVNDLKKPKNVNFCTSKVDELYRDASRSRSRSLSSSEVGDARDHEQERDHDLVDLLREENERLKTFARQQREHIDELSSHQARLQAELAAARFRTEVPRPRTAPTAMIAQPPPSLRLNTTASVNSVGWRKGAGEELSMFAHAQPRVLLPGDTLPFVGVPRDRPCDTRRHLINQWRLLRHRGERPAPARRPAHDTANPVFSFSQNEEEDVEETPEPRNDETFTFTAVSRQKPKSGITQENSESEIRRSKENSSKTAREVREKPKLQNPAREQSPSTVLREAKLRLRKLELEAEAVERAYQDFRRRQAELRAEPRLTCGEDTLAGLDIRKSRSHHKIEESYRAEVPHFTITPDPAITKRDFDKYLCEYQSKLDAAVSRFKDTRSSGKINPIPAAYSKIEGQIDESQDMNYLETPLTEFRKLYTQKTPYPSVPVHLPQSETPVKRTRPKSPVHITEPPELPNSVRESTDSKSKSIRSVKTKEDELEILKDNISKMYNLQDESEIEQKIEGALVKSESREVALEENLIVEVEHVSEANSLKVTESETQGDLLLVVESSVDTREMAVVGNEVEEREKMSTHMTIIVSPKRSVPNGIKNVERSPRSVSPEQAARLTRNDALNAIFHAEASKQQSSIEMELNISKDQIEDTISDLNKGGDDYPDDFSADVDNYNSRSDYDHSPISLPKNSEDDNFWDT